MEDRLALVVRSKEELVIGLQACLAAEKGDKPKSSVPVFSGNAENGSSDLEALLDGPLREMVIETLLSENNLEKIAFCWTKGVQIPWEKLYQGKGARRIPCQPIH
nr:hypothetical protein [Bacillus subtilis]